MPGLACTRASRSAGVCSASAPLKMPTRMAPRSRRCRVSARVSMPLMPTMPCSTSSSSRLRVARQFEEMREGSRTT